MFRPQLEIKGATYLHIRRVAALCDLSVQSIQAACRRGSVEAVVVGGTRYIKESSLKSFLHELQKAQEHKSLTLSRTRRAEAEERRKSTSAVRRVGGEIRKRRAKHQD